jgi:hypothetical protein
MSGIFDKLKDAGKDALGTFVVMEDDADAATPAQPAAGRTGAAAPAGAAAPVAEAAGSAAPDPEFVQQLKSCVDGSKKAALPQFRTLFGALGAVSDEATRTQLALSAAQASHGFGAAEVADAIDDRLKILATEKSSFEKAVQDESTQSVGAMQAEIEKTRAEVTRRIEEIKALETKATALEQKARDARAAIEANAARFAASYALVQAELAAERSRVAPFLPTPAK